MMASSREGNYQAKQEGGDTSMDNIEKKFKAPSSTSRQWSTSSLRNPRIVRVSRTFGGKDRHSKVCTIRGLRDRRIRLSVPTAIQLYDLQDKLGLGQPSKVIDWLLEATKLDIDKLPPLQFPQSFSQFHPLHSQTLLPFHDQSSNIASHELSLGPLYDPNSTFVGIQNLMARSKFWDIDSRTKGKEVEREYFSEKDKWIKTNEEENQVGEASYNNFHQVSTQKLFPMETHSNFLNNAMSYNNYHSEASSLSLSQFGSSNGLFQSHQQVDPNQSNGNGLHFPFPFANSQLLFGPSSSSTTPSSSHLSSTPFMNNPVENDPRIQFNHFQFINSSSSQTMPHPLIPSFHHSFNSPPVRPFPVPFSSKLLDFNNNNNSNQPDDDSARRS